jgi:hypothetical protein
MIFGILTLLVALTISGVAIYYSVAGLVAIFAAASIPIIIMGGALEIGKLVAAVWLHKYWSRAVWWMRLYLSTAVLVLMFITSMGIFGFLSKAHIEQTAAAKEQQALLQRFDKEVARQNEIIQRAEQRIKDAQDNAEREDIGIQEKIDAEQDRIDTAYNRRQPSIDEQQAIIAAQKNIKDKRVAVFEDEIQSLDVELQRLNSLVDQYRQELTNTNVASVEEQVQPYIEQLSQLDDDIARLDAQAADYEQRITTLTTNDSAIQSLREQIAAIEENIVVTTNKLQSTETSQIREGQSVIGVTDDGLFGGNTRRALTSWVTAQQQRISQLQSQEAALQLQAQDTVNIERERLTKLITSLRGDQTQAVQKRKQSLLDTIDRIRQDAASGLQIQRDTIQSKIDAILNVDIPANRQERRSAQEEITNLRNTNDPVVIQARTEIAKIRQLAEDEIAQAQNLIERLRNEITVGDNTNLEAIIDEQVNRITQANSEIDNLTTQKFELEAQVRKLEAEVGPVKYLAEAIYEDADRNTLEDAVRWVILIIIVVFDPLAVALLIAAQYIFEWRREDKNKLKKTTSAPAISVTSKWDEAEVEVEIDKESTSDDTSVIDNNDKIEDNEKVQSYESIREERTSDKLFAEQKELDNDDYNPYTDKRSDNELTDSELTARKEIWPDGYTGKLAPTKPFKE